MLSIRKVNIFYKKYFFDQQISLLDWFLKDHVTMKTGFMVAFYHKNKSHFNIKIEYIYFIL